MRTEINKIAKLIDDSLEYDNWTGINVQKALKDVTPVIAVHRFNKNHLNIAELVAHIICWNKIMTERLDKHNHEPAKEEDFPVVDELTDEQWYDMKLELARSFHLLKGKLENKDDDILDKPIFEGASDAYRNLHGQIAHIHYHLGQIVLLKKLLS